MNYLPASVRQSRGCRRFCSFSVVALAGILVSCAGPKTTKAGDKVEVKSGPMNRVTVTIEKERVTVETEPVPIWQSIISGVTGGLLKFATSKEPTP